MRKYLCGVCVLAAFGAVAQEEVVVSEETTAEVMESIIKKEVVVTETIKTETVATPEEVTKEDVSVEETRGTEETKAEETTAHEVKITHAVGYAPYEEGRPIEAFFAGLVGTRLDTYVVQQYYQPADDASRHCFILVSEELQKKVKKCVQLEPTVSFKEAELYTILGDND